MITLLNKILYIKFFLLALSAGNLLHAQIKLPALVSDSMILQRDRPTRIWGWNLSGDNVLVKFNNKEYIAKPDTAKYWEVTLQNTQAGGPYTIDISSGKQSVILNEIFFGDVWLCSGQSNMGFTMQELSHKYPEDLKNSDNNLIREFAVGRQISFEAKDNVAGKWKRACPGNISKFSAVAYYMAKNLFEKYHVPIGIINASWGGTPAESWTSEDGLQDFEDIMTKLQLYKNQNYLDSLVTKEKQVSDAWYANSRKSDNPVISFTSNYNLNEKNIDTASWRTMKMPGYWENYGAKDLDGVVWVKKKIVLSENDLGKDATLYLGMIDDADTTYFNGVKIGFNTQKYAQRIYKIPAKLLKKGVNIIVSRIVDTDGLGGFSPERKYGLVTSDKELDITGNWQYKVAVKLPPLKFEIYNKTQLLPTTLYNGMIAPLVKYAIKGVAWYQGESNTAFAGQYQKLLPSLIANWRKYFNQGDFPFLIVQLANYMKTSVIPSESNWAALREAQLLTAQKVPNCGLAVTIDIGDSTNIHPLNKPEAGRRLALIAENRVYGDKKIVHSGPTYHSMKVDGKRIILYFNNYGSHLAAKDTNVLRQFAIAGSDKKFVWAKAYIENDKVIVESDNVRNPVAVRYAWADNPFGCNLYNKEGLPASPFRTDDW